MWHSHTHCSCDKLLWTEGPVRPVDTEAPEKETKGGPFGGLDSPPHNNFTAPSSVGAPLAEDQPLGSPQSILR